MAKKLPKTAEENTTDKNLAVNDKSSSKNADKKGKPAQGPKKPNIFKRFGKLCKEVFSELKKVSWPGGKTIMSQTGIVVAVVLCFFVVLLGMDSLLNWLLGLLLGY